MLSREVVAFFIERVPDEIRVLRDNIAKAETDDGGPMWDRQREAHAHITELKDKCGEAGHPLIIALAGKSGKRRRLMKDGQNERRACIMCGTEEVGTLATGFPPRFLLRKAKWKFDKFNGHISRIFTDPEWYFETLSVIRNFSFPTNVVLHHAFPPRLPFSFLGSQGEK